MNQRNLNSAVRLFFQNTVILLAVSIVAAFVLIFIENFQAVVINLDEGSGLSSDTTSEVIRNTVDTISTEIDNIPYLKVIGIAILVVVALGAGYVLFGSAFIRARNEIILSQNARDSKAKLFLVQRALLKFAVAITLLLLVIFSIKVSIPYFVDLAGLYVQSSFDSAALTDFALGSFGLILNFFVLLSVGLFGFRYERNV